MVALAGLPPFEIAMDSLRMAGGTYLVAAGGTPEVLRKEGPWAKETGYYPYVRSHGGAGVGVQCSSIGKG